VLERRSCRFAIQPPISYKLFIRLGEDNDGSGSKDKSNPGIRPPRKEADPSAEEAAASGVPCFSPLKPEAIQAASAESPKPKQKPVRDGFTMPRHDFALIGTLKERMVAFRRPTRKSELLRAGLHALMALPDARLAAALDGLAPLRPGRPKKSG
jgi:hypothetical protein